MDSGFDQGQTSLGTGTSVNMFKVVATRIGRDDLVPIKDPENPNRKR